ncbi:MAG: FAD-dependent oxidoreductase [Thermaceae bacterium]
MILVLGAGIAGLSLAWYLKRRKRRVLVVAERLGEASRVPIALVSPLRGSRPAVVSEGPEALEVARGFYSSFLPLRFGLFKPVAQEEREAFERRLGASALPYEWRRLRGQEGVYLPTVFWLEARPLLERLAEEMEVVFGRAVAWDGTLYLADGRRYTPEVLVYAGGAKGALLFGLEGRLVAGLELLIWEYIEPALSQRVFLAGNALGGSYLNQEEYEEPPPTEGEMEWLLSGAEALLGHRPRVLTAWRGVRFRRSELLSPIPGGYALAGFGSTGFLFAPLWAKRLAEAL